MQESVLPDTLDYPTDNLKKWCVALILSVPSSNTIKCFCVSAECRLELDFHSLHAWNFRIAELISMRFDIQFN